MATSDLPEEGPGLHVTAMDAAFRAAWNRIPAVNPTPTEVRAAVRAALVAAAPHIRADERARVLDEVQAALRDDQRWWNWYRAKTPDGTWLHMAEAVRPAQRRTAADYLRDTLGAGGEG